MSDRCPHTGRKRDYVSTHESIARYGYVLTLRWGSCAFEADAMDGKRRVHAAHVREIEPASQDVAAAIGQMTTDRMFAIQRAARGPVTAYFDCQHKPLAECEILGWMRRISSKGWGTFEITDAGRDIEARFCRASAGART